MNYYERHIGDYLKDTAHLSLLEHGVYTRLMDVYYTRESAIPQSEVARLVGAKTKDEREALQVVLGEFFVLMDGAWNQKRCEEELMAYRESQGGVEDKKANDKDRQRRARERRKNLFEELRSHGVVPPWDTKTADLQQMLSRVTGGPPSAPVTPPVTRDNTATQTPDTRHQTPIDRGPRESATGAGAPADIVGDAKPTRAGELCRLMRAEGIQTTNPGNPDLLALIAAGVTDDEIRGAARAAAGKGDPFTYALAALTKQRQRAAAVPLHIGPLPPTETAYQRSMRERYEQAAPSVAAKAPGTVRPNPMEVLDGFVKCIG